MSTFNECKTETVGNIISNFRFTTWATDQSPLTHSPIPLQEITLI